MATHREGDYNTVEAGADLAELLVVKLSSGKAVLATAGSDAIVGVVEHGGKSGDSISYKRLNGVGSFKVKLGASVSAGALLTAGAGGKAVTATTGNNAFGRALVAGGADDVVEYELLDKVA